jgi:hypothetical protein
MSAPDSPTAVSAALSRPGRKALFAAFVVALGISSPLLLLYGYAVHRIKVDPLPIPPVRFQGGFSLQEDQELGFVSPPGSRIVRTDLNSGLAYHLYHNRRSARVNGPGEEVEGSVDIMTVGCSFSYGYGFENELTYTERLGRLLRKRVINLSLGSYGTVQALQMLRRNKDLRPKLVIYGFMNAHLGRNLRPCASNYIPVCVPYSYVDFRDASPYIHKPLTRRYPIALQRDYYTGVAQLPEGPTALPRLLWRLRLDLAGATAPEGPPRTPENELEAFRFLLSEMHKTAEEIQATLLVLYLPHPLFPEVEWPAPTYVKVVKELKDVIVRVNMVRVARKNLSPALIVHARDRHPSPRMHELTALELSRVIREQGVFSDPAPERR